MGILDSEEWIIQIYFGGKWVRSYAFESVYPSLESAIDSLRVCNPELYYRAIRNVTT